MDENNAAVGWQTNPSRRGTLTVIENCLFTIFACTWSIQHLNVPGLGDTCPEKLVRKGKWTVVTLFFPEFIMAHAILELVMAYEDMVSLNKGGRLDPPWWFRRQPPKNSSNVESGPEAPPETTGGNPGQQETRWTITHCYFANMGGFYRQKVASSPSNAKNYSLLTARHFIDSWEDIEVPKLSEDDLNDKSKTDYFTKALAVSQIAQLLLSLIVRAVRHLAFSQLETLTLAFAICGVLTYMCHWYKPQDVRRPIEVQVQRRHISSQLPPDEESFDSQQTFDRLWDILTNSKSKDSSQTLTRIPNDNIPKTGPQTTHYALYVLTALTAGFGSIHTIAWNFEFPTLAEQILWRTASLVSTAIPPLALLTIPLSQILRPWGDSGDFMHTCLRVMREYSWHAANKEPVWAAMKTLEEACNNTDIKRLYKEIFIRTAPNGSPEFLGRKLFSFIYENGEFQGSNSLVLSDDFVKKFKKLVEILHGTTLLKRDGQLVDIPNQKAVPKKLIDEARTNVYPQRVRFPEPVNRAIIYATGITYCLARLTVIGVAFSSLRRMPDSVYATTWARNIPSVQ